ncbi:MAG: hypothetical protein LCH85_22255 [Chloroflexi bacterium]|nr:hypothetical protein [Chloroflexota bacterium]
MAPKQRQGESGRNDELSLDELAKKILEEDTIDLIEEVDIIEDIPLNQRKKQFAAFIIIGNRIYYNFRGSVTIKKALAILSGLITGSGGIVWLVNHYILPLLSP